MTQALCTRIQPDDYEPEPRPVLRDSGQPRCKGELIGASPYRTAL
jgi:hypothetical protein